MKNAKIFAGITLLSGVALTLAACGNSESNSNESSTAAKFSSAVPKKATKNGGTVKVAVETDTPFTGIFNDELSTSATDTEVMQYGAESLFATDDQYVFTDKGAATIKINQKAKTATINIKKNVKWSDGKPVTAKDYEYAYEIIANKATKSQRYTSSLADLVGLEEYHEGKSNTISGIEMPDGDNGRKVILHFKTMKPGMNTSGNGYIWEKAAPYHYLKDVKFKDLMSSDKIRKKPLFFGAYKLQKVVRGQSVTWVPNEYYYKGKPKLSKITASVINPNSVAQSIKSNKFDVISVINSQWQNVKGTKGVNFIAQVPLSYSYLGFKVGKWDAQRGENVMNPKSKMNNKALRQAIAYGMNVDQVYKRYTYGLSFRVPTLIPKQFGDYFDKNVKGYSYNIKKGNEILDKAGFKKKGTYRVQPNGKPLTIRLAAMTGNSTQEPIVQNYIQQWKKEGLNVKLTGGRLIEFNSFYDKIENDDPSVDMFLGAWSLSSEPSPNDLYGEKAPMNYSRFVTKKNNQLLEEMDSQKAFNHTYRVDKFHEWQKYMDDQAYVVPVANSYSISAVNKKLTGYSLKPSDSMGNGFPNWYNVAYAK
ncbi:oligopeptide ABC transporter substrate-binding protein [Lactobacillus acidophilus]|uniref:oligopeptide ABC transporter substrate-binding protein n=1 Tax=Lactobacillus acidophilus TaxID=1579 RepID=UPI000354F2DE|nr:oligopeptide ABC transporter substrate-binding protein [Lactobacillus acidophilus]MBN3483737.1 oligopeptide ABC transporter substrate-binding protein [Lactobacillus acidophilus]MCT3628114.1 oligopeptide ABC transporter substrate-binding protein [Lactobacillus acidophilus]UEX75953.1 oligopeptide ABC transporter substrate-binding protein [Lactobacillus acidophilus]UIP48476.1 oligopeptide ABC transporter substrate-binding protein [Lactobacillus acidophilus]UTX30656.1 oligopeptide ABC transport